MSQQHYLPSKSRDDVERERLGLLETCNDPFTVTRLEALGVKEGWNCLEVGAGRGSIAMWLTSRVGHSGKIVATDVDTRYLQNLSIPNLEVRKHDITKDELEEGQYDLVHCRALLLHLREPEKALERMAKAIRRGGWIFVEESDWGLFGAIDPDHPSAALFNQVHQAGLDLVQRLGIMNPYFGRRVRSLVENLGFTEVGHEGLARVGLTIPQAGILYYLKTAEEPLTPMKLSHRAHRRPHTVSALVKRMEAQGLVKTTKDLKRKNWVRVSLTKKGEEAFKRQITERTVRNVTSCLSKKELESLNAICHKLHGKGVELIRQMQPGPYYESPLR